MGRVALPRVRGYQEEVYCSGARFKLVMCGRRWGKSKLGLMCAVDGHGPERGFWRGALQGARIGWVVPSEDHPAAAEAWEDVKAAVAGIAVTVSEDRRLAMLPGGGSVQLWSGHDPDRLRGPYFDGVIVDECSIQSPKVWAALRPTLSDYGGWAVLCGRVPEDVVGHWFVGLHRVALTPSMRARGWETWRRPSSDCERRLGSGRGAELKVVQTGPALRAPWWVCGSW